MDFKYSIAEIVHKLSPHLTAEDILRAATDWVIQLQAYDTYSIEPTEEPKDQWILVPRLAIQRALDTSDNYVEFNASIVVESQVPLDLQPSNQYPPLGTLSRLQELKPVRSYNHVKIPLTHLRCDQKSFDNFIKFHSNKFEIKTRALPEKTKKTKSTHPSKDRTPYTKAILKAAEHLLNESTPESPYWQASGANLSSLARGIVKHQMEFDDLKGHKLGTPKAIANRLYEFRSNLPSKAKARH